MAGWDFLDVLGDADSHYRGETGELKNNRTDINYDAGDHLRWLAVLSQHVVQLTRGCEAATG